VREALRVEFVDEVDQVLDLAFGSALRERRFAPPRVDPVPERGEPMTVVSIADGGVEDTDGTVRA
jgi:hypothetical protein